MSMNVAGDKSGVMCEVNMTPLIDVMLVLIVTLIMTLPIQTHAVKLDMPPPTDQPPPPVLPEVINLDVDFDDTVYWDGNKVDLNQLEGYFRVESKKDPQPEIHLRPDKRSHYDTTAKVLASAQRNHMTKIGFVNTTEFSE
jgi:biopolymer transport protein ExbD